MRINVILMVLLAALLVGCGDDEGSGGGGEELTVSGASSLQTAFNAYGEQFGDVRLSFAGSDELAAQVREGAPVDVFASANTSLPEDLAKEGIVEEPTVFAGNRLVLAVPADGSDIKSLADIAAPGVKLAVGSKVVPIGSYTREVLGKLPADQANAILANVRTEEPDVKGIVGKLTQGAADAGFVYITDVTATKGELKAIDLPKAVAPAVAYGVVIVKDSENKGRAQEFIDGLLSGEGQSELKAAGFLPPPA